jgi:beta-N-acetylglucosaminidase
MNLQVNSKKIVIALGMAAVFSAPIFVNHNAFMQPLSLERGKNAYSMKAENMKILMSNDEEHFIAVKQNDPYDKQELVAVPDKYRKSIALEIDARYDSKPIKIYGSADERTELNTNYVLPNQIFTNDLRVYNDHFIKVNDKTNNAVYYVDMLKSNWRSISGAKLRIVGAGDDRSVIAEGERNLTMQLNARTNVSASDLRKITAGTELEGIEDALVAAENRYGVNSIFILSVAIHESGWGSSYLARSRNNLFGICAFDSNVDAASSFSSKAECVDYFARLMSKEYFPEGRTTLTSINAIYASSGSWASNVYDSMTNIINRI